jgi:hypothetical protein
LAEENLRAQRYCIDETVCSTRRHVQAICERHLIATHATRLAQIEPLIYGEQYDHLRLLFELLARTGDGTTLFRQQFSAYIKVSGEFEYIFNFRKIF